MDHPPLEVLDTLTTLTDDELRECVALNSLPLISTHLAPVDLPVDGEAEIGLLAALTEIPLARERIVELLKCRSQGHEWRLEGDLLSSTTTATRRSRLLSHAATASDSAKLGYIAAGDAEEPRREARAMFESLIGAHGFEEAKRLVVEASGEFLSAAALAKLDVDRLLRPNLLNLLSTHGIGLIDVQVYCLYVGCVLRVHCMCGFMFVERGSSLRKSVTVHEVSSSGCVSR